MNTYASMDAAEQQRAKIETKRVMRRNRLEPTLEQLRRWTEEGWHVRLITDRMILLERSAQEGAEGEEAEDADQESGLAG